MKKTNISNELLAKFLDGQTSEEENAQILALLADDKELMEEFTAIAEAARLADSAPIAEPDLNMATQQIHENINTQVNTYNSIHITNTQTNTYNNIHITQNPSKKRFFIALAAAVVTMLIASTIYLLMRPSSNEDFLAKQEGTNIDTVLTKTEQDNILIAENEIPQTTDKTGTNGSQKLSSSNETSTPSSSSNPSTGDNSNVQMIEKNYASKAEVNNLTMLTPPRADYGIIFKNLNKSFKFEWSTGNVQSLNFTIKDSQGKIIAIITDPLTNHYELKGSTIYPEKQVSWNIVVRYKDNTEEQRNGQIRIGYEINN